MPATPTRITSLAPRTWPDDFVPAMVTVAAAASVCLMKPRRVIRGMACVLQGCSGLHRVHRRSAMGSGSSSFPRHLFIPRAIIPLARTVGKENVLFATLAPIAPCLHRRTQPPLEHRKPALRLPRATNEQKHRGCGGGLQVL